MLLIMRIFTVKNIVKCIIHIRCDENTQIKGHTDPNKCLR